MDIINGILNDDRCLPPCSSTLFNVKLKNYESNEDVNAIYIEFKSMIEIKNTHYKLDTFTLLSNLGGVIGLGRNAFWLIASIGGILKLLLYLTKKKYFS